MRGEDRPAALAFLDQHTILRQVFSKIHSVATSTQSFSGDRFPRHRSFARTRNQTETVTTGDRATRQHTGDAKLIERTCERHS